MESRSSVLEGLMKSLAALLASGLLCAGMTACGGTKGNVAVNAAHSSASAAAHGTTSSTSSSSEDSTSSSAGGATISGEKTANSGGRTASAGGKASSPPQSGSGATSSTASVIGVPPGDQDGDSPNDKAFDKDDSFVTTFGHAASPTDRRSIASLVTRYYAAIAKDDGATACRLLFFVIVESAPETYGQTAFDATAGRGKSCGPVMTKVFKGNHAQLVAENRHLKVMAVRVEGKRAWVLLRLGPDSVRRMIAYREGSVWKIGELIDTELV